jgi:hypothetical protein
MDLHPLMPYPIFVWDKNPISVWDKIEAGTLSLLIFCLFAIQRVFPEQCRRALWPLPLAGENPRFQELPLLPHLSHYLPTVQQKMTAVVPLLQSAWLVSKVSISAPLSPIEHSCVERTQIHHCRIHATNQSHPCPSRRWHHLQRTSVHRQPLLHNRREQLLRRRRKHVSV